MGNVLVVAEHLHGKFPKTTLVSVAAGLEAAKHAGGKAIGVVLGKGVDALASELASYGIDVVAVDGAPFEHYLADAYTAAIAEVAKQKGATRWSPPRPRSARTSCRASPPVSAPAWRRR
jgi:electron transfer flavoprotein alpha subunit